MKNIPLLCIPLMYLAAVFLFLIIVFCTFLVIVGAAILYPLIFLINAALWGEFRGPKRYFRLVIKNLEGIQSSQH